MEKDKSRDSKLEFKPLSDGLGFHPFSDGMPYAPVSKKPLTARKMGLGAEAAGPPSFARPGIPGRPSQSSLVGRAVQDAAREVKPSERA
ncbi:MAG: hypothetical protein AAB425_14940, partial [Bdellovibrionota bacterium]